MKFYIIAGEASGDLHASNLMRELNSINKKLEFRCWGGNLMAQQGGVMVKHYSELAFMGFLEVVLNLRTILRNLAFCKKDILEYKPDAVILIDYPGFNLKIAEFLHLRKIPVIYYISPQVWAWKQSRMKTIRKVVDKMMVILPFEKEFYAQHGMEVEFHGHPLLDVLEQSNFKPVFPDEQRPVVALLPGSRKQEIQKNLPAMVQAAGNFPDVRFVIAGVGSYNEDFYHKIAGHANIPVVTGRTYDLLKQAKAAIVTSGTATLETAIIGTPEMVCYKGGTVSYYIAKKLIKVKYISLVNLIMDRVIVKELIQNEMSAANLTRELDLLLNEKIIKQQLEKDYSDLLLKLGGKGASKRAANSVLQFMKTKTFSQAD
ncbi:MAG: lipid-A-disaccharide synthase [Lentimicrobium sp.]|nr:lipid-A-disaccharide synthase [Lentimicrobium sp.]